MIKWQTKVIHYIQIRKSPQKMQIELSESEKNPSPGRKPTPNRIPRMNIMNDEEEYFSQRCMLPIYYVDSKEANSNPLMLYSPMVNEDEHEVDLVKLQGELEKERESEREEVLFRKEQSPSISDIISKKTKKRRKSQQNIVKEEYKEGKMGIPLSNEKNQLDEEHTQFQILSQYYAFIEAVVFEKSNITLFALPVGFEETEGEIPHCFYFKQNQREQPAKNKKSSLMKFLQESKPDNPGLRHIHEQVTVKQEEQVFESENEHEHEHISISNYFTNQFAYPESNTPSPEQSKPKQIERMQLNLLGISRHEFQPNESTKKLMIILRNNLQKISSVLSKRVKLARKESNSMGHTCRVCGQTFNCGRKLGGHMSRKHPGSSHQYMKKKEVYRMKEVQRKRRLYFKDKN